MILESKSPAETRKIAARSAKEILKLKTKAAVVIALEGNLGSGKTTFARGFARGLGIREKILSPTFVLLKIYPINKKKFKHFLHFDCYRLTFAEELSHLGFKDFLKDKDAVVLIEWAERARKMIPENAIRIKFEHGAKPGERILKIYNLNL